MSNTTPTAQPTSTNTAQRLTRLVTIATDFIEQHKGEPLSHSQHSKELAKLLQASYEKGRRDAQQEILDILDREVIERIQARCE